jgi:hypothetical protein
MQVYDLYRRPVLVTRESAHALRELLAASRFDPRQTVLDFAGVEAVTPSFFDELVGEIVDVLGDRAGVTVSLVNFPTRLSTKYEAIARGRNITLGEPTPGRWDISF